MGEYLKYSRDWYDVWNTSEFDINKGIKRLKRIQDYFNSITCYNSDVRFHIATSIDALERLYFRLQASGVRLTRLSHLSSLVVENQFSQV